MVCLQTTVLHAGGLVLSLFLLIYGYVKPQKSYFFSVFSIYVVCIIIAQTLNTNFYNSGILNGKSLTLMPVFSIIEQYVYHIIYVVLYVFSFMLGSSVVYFLTKLGYKLQMNYMNRFYLHFPHKDKSDEESFKVLKKSLEDNKPYK